MQKSIPLTIEIVSRISSIFMPWIFSKQKLCKVQGKDQQTRVYECKSTLLSTHSTLSLGEWFEELSFIFLFWIQGTKFRQKGSWPFTTRGTWVVNSNFQLPKPIHQIITWMCKVSVHSNQVFTLKAGGRTFTTWFSHLRSGEGFHNQVFTHKVGKSFTPSILCKRKDFHIQFLSIHLEKPADNK